MIPSSSNSINFVCPSCRTQLSVPASMAGVTGPCPTCQNQLTAPALGVPGPPLAPPPAQQAPAMPPMQQVAPSAAPPTQPPQPPVQQQAPPPVQQAPPEQILPPVQVQAQQAPPAQALPPVQVQAQQAPPEQTLPPIQAQNAAAPPAENVEPQVRLPVPPAQQTPPEPKQPQRREPLSRAKRHRQPDEKAKPKRAVSGKVIAGLAAVGLLAGTAFAVPKVMEFFGKANAEGPQTTKASGDVIPKTLDTPPPKQVPTGPQPPANGHVFHGTKPTLEDEPKFTPIEDEPPALEGILDEPREFLENYLTSLDWKSLIPKSLSGESLSDTMAAYYKANPYTPEKILEMTFQHKQKLPDSENQFYLFKVITESNSGSFPMTVEETSSGFKTDWQAYVQFKDSNLQKFLDNPKASKSGKGGKGEIKTFNVIMRRAHDFTDEVPNTENKWCYKIDAPVDNLPGGFCFVPKYSKYGDKLDEDLKWLKLYFLIVEMRWEIDADSPDKPFVRLMKIRQFNWRGHDPNAVQLDTLTDASN